MGYMWGFKKTKVISDYWDGFAFTKKNTESLFGQFINIYNSIFVNSDIREKFIIPRVCVIGSESTGKSSLLENITKCPIFPRDISICTKQPIKLVLKPAKTSDEISYKISYNNEIFELDKMEIENKIKSIMCETENDSIVDNEIIIEIIDENLPYFEFYDLPGIRAYPPPLSKKTIELAEKYIKDPNNIILCIIPATVTRITSYEPIALVKKYKKESNTIIALTMADRVQPENIEELLVNRIIDNTDEFSHNEFAGCTAIINRSHLNSISLNGIPEGFDKEKTQLLHQNINVTNLITNLDNLYNKFIKEKWIPNTINDINENIKSIENRITALG